MRTRSFLALLLGPLLMLSLVGCATGGKKTARKPKVTPEARMAIKHYKLGIDSYTNSRYAEAINHWKITLEKDPANPNAAEYIGRAENMLKATGKPVPTNTAAKN